MIDTPNRFPMVAQRLFNRPHLIRPERAEMLVCALAQRLNIVSLDMVMPDGARRMDRAEMAATVHMGLQAPPAEAQRYYDLIQGVGIIEIEGTLVMKNGTLQPYSGMTGYDGIRANLAVALDDDACRGIILNLDTGGGEGSGLFDLCDAISAANQKNGGPKPIWAVLAEEACSAGYALAAACDRIIQPRTGLSGSIGAWVMHVDWSEALKMEGIAVTILQAGAHKTDGHPYAPLPKTVADDILADLESLRSLFIASLGRYRGQPESLFRDTEARVFRGPDALKLGLVDAVMAPDDALAELIELIGAA